ncbi:MAG: cation transporter [Lachnospiraceae bacterium]|nr:cation transporter [Lachnospiraceae bacterium]
MKRTFILEDLDCAHCAAKIQEEVGKLDGVSNCVVTFLTTKMVYDVEDDKDKEVEKKMRAIVKQMEPDVEVISK